MAFQTFLFLFRMDTTEEILKWALQLCHLTVVPIKKRKSLIWLGETTRYHLKNITLTHEQEILFFIDNFSVELPFENY